MFFEEGHEQIFLAYEGVPEKAIEGLPFFPILICTYFLDPLLDLFFVVVPENDGKLGNPTPFYFLRFKDGYCFVFVDGVHKVCNL